MDRREEGRVTNKRVFLSFYLFTFNNRGNIVISLAYLFVFHVRVCVLFLFICVCENVQMGPAFVFYQEKKKRRA